MLEKKIYKRLTTAIDERVFDRLKDLSKSEGVSMAQITEIALNEFLKKNEKQLTLGEEKNE